MADKEPGNCWKRYLFYSCVLSFTLIVIGGGLFHRHFLQLYYVVRLSSVGTPERDASAYIQELASCSTEQELESMVIASPKGILPYGRLNGYAELALAEKDTGKAHAILEDLIKNGKSDKILAIRGLVASATYDQNRLFSFVKQDRKLLWAAISMHMVYERIDYLPVLQEYYEMVRKDAPESYESGKLAAYLAKHKVK